MEELFQHGIEILKNKKLKNSTKAKVYSEIHAELIDQISKIPENDQKEAQIRLNSLNSIARKMFLPKSVF